MISPSVKAPFLFSLLAVCSVSANAQPVDVLPVRAGENALGVRYSKAMQELQK